MDAGGGFTFGETAVAHVALADDAEAFVVFRDIIRALEHAVLAADALIIEVADNAGERIFS